jgi:polysaccharide biosynthesis/export protein
VAASALLRQRSMSRCLLLAVTAGLALTGGSAAAQTPSTSAPTPAPAAASAPPPASPAPAVASPAPAGTPRTAAATTAVRTPARVGSATPTQPEYRIGTGDKLQINVYKENDLSQALQVRPDGRITMPLLGDLAAAGQTPMQLQGRLAESLREYVSNPVVTVMVVEVADRVVYVMGEVNTPGVVPLKGSMTVLQALAVAGGFKDFANKGGIKVLRKVGPDRVETIPFSYKDSLRGDAQPFYLVEGDTVVVP